jgi:hypothetical protein
MARGSYRGYRDGSDWAQQSAKAYELDREWQTEQRLAREAEARYRKAQAKHKVDVQTFKQLAATRTTTAVGKDGGSWQEAIDGVLVKFAADENYNPRNEWVVTAIRKLSGDESAPKDGVPVVAQAAPVAPKGDPATDKQVNFVKVLLRKHEVTEEILAKVDEALLTKAGASQLIGLLKGLPEKAKA